MAKEFAKRQLQYEQGGGSVGRKPSFNSIFTEAMMSVVPVAFHRPTTYINGYSQTPKYFEGLVKEARKALLQAPVQTVAQPAPTSAPAPAPEPVVEKEVRPPSEMEGIEALLRENREGQERIEAKLEHSHGYAEHLFVILEAILTAPVGTKPEELMKQPEIKAAVQAMARPEVILAGIPPRHEESIVRQYGTMLKLRVYPVGSTRQITEITNLSKIDHIISASELHGTGLERVMKEKGYRKRLIKAGGMTDVRRTLDTILRDPSKLYPAEGAGR